MIAKNIISVMEDMGFSKQKKMRCYISRCLDVKESVVYCWFGTSRDSKFPFKLLLRLSLILGCSPERLLSEDEGFVTREDVRVRSIRNEALYNRIVEKHLEDTSRPYKEIADELGIVYNTVRRILIHYYDGLGEEVTAGRKRKMDSKLRV